MELFLQSVILMGVLGLGLGLVIGIVAKLFQVESDSRVELVLELLPGANCGGCGRAGCADFAKAVVAGECPPSKCPVSSAEQISSIARALGIAAGDGFRYKAVVLCGGDVSQITRPIHYNGVADCVSASLVGGGPKGCSHGCLGLGSCARRCPFGAIEMANNLAVVHPELCVGCGACAAVCPRGVIKLVPVGAQVHVYCNSQEKAPAKRKVCKVACLGCRKCVRSSPEKFTADGFLASARYDGPGHLATPEDAAAAECPTGALLEEAEHLRIERHDPEWSADRDE